MTSKNSTDRQAFFNTTTNSKEYFKQYYSLYIKKCSIEEYIREFLRITSNLGKYLTRKGFDEISKIPSMGIIKGLRTSWRELLTYYNKLESLYDYASQEYLTHAMKNGKSDSTKFIKEHPYLKQYVFSDVIDIAIVRKRCGFINEHYKGNYNDSILRNHFYKIKNKIGKIPSVTEFLEHASILPSIYCDYYGISNQYWDEILGIMINDKTELDEYFEQRNMSYIEKSVTSLINYKNENLIPISELEIDFKKVFDLFHKNYGTYPTRRLFNRHSKYSYRTICERLNLKWSEVAKYYGYKIKEKNVSEKVFLEMIKGIVNCDYERNKTWSWLIGIKGKHLYCDGYFEKINLIVEFDGKQHRTPVPNFGGTERFLKDKQNDEIKERLAIEKKYIFLRVSSKEKWYDIEYLKNRLRNAGINIK